MLPYRMRLTSCMLLLEASTCQDGIKTPGAPVLLLQTAATTSQPANIINTYGRKLQPGPSCRQLLRGLLDDTFTVVVACAGCSL
jgi:hypothetical protein